MKQAIASATKWSFLSEIASRIIPPISYILLIRYLSPEDFGVVAIAVMVIGLSRVIADAGLSKALIQNRKDPLSAANTIFWTNAVFGLFVYLLCVVSASPLSIWFDDERIVAIVKVQGIQIIFAALSSCHVALFQRDLNFRKLFWVRVVSQGLPGIVALVFAFVGYGYWALVIGNISGAFFEMILLWNFSQWRPKLFFDIDKFLEAIRYGAWITFEALLAWVFMWVDIAIVAKYLDIHNAGIYRTGSMIVLLIFGLLINPMLPVFFSWFSRLQADKEQLRIVLMESTKVLAMVALPAAVSIWLLSDYCETYFLRKEWHGIGLVIGYMGLAYGISWIISANNEAYRAIGRADMATKILIIAFLYYFPVYLVAITFGLETFLFARVILSITGVILHLYVCGIIIGLKPKELLGELRGTVIAITFMALSMIGVRALFDEQQITALEPFLVCLVGFIVYAVMQFKEWSYIRRIVKLVLKS